MNNLGLSILSPAIAAILGVSPGWSQDQKAPAAKVTVDQNAAVHLPPLVVPFSTFASPEAKVPFLANGKFQETYAKAKTIAEQRQAFSDFMQPGLARTKVLYPADSVATTIAGVYTDVITPKGGIAARNRNRVLINLHGGGFMIGARIMGAMESMPVASLGKIKVVTVDYRQGPEHKFPAASEDVAAVYKELLKTYKPRNIGIYGCSAGGVLTAEATAWIANEKLPAPGAIGILCASAAGWSGGDSGHVALPLDGVMPSREDSGPPHPSVSNAAYFSDADFNDPLVEPIRSTAVLAKFPPTLIVTSTRDLAMSPAVYTHTQLVKLGVAAELHVWEGMVHGFFTTEPDLPETREVWDVVTKFFDQHLGTE
jgi:monoterpene epsilon-lactone hydrolase